MHTDALTKRQWDAKEALVTLISDLETQARYGAAARCRAVLSKMIAGDVAGMASSTGVIADAANASQAGICQIFAGLASSLNDESDYGLR